jgi:hypothetical protein
MKSIFQTLYQTFDERATSSERGLHEWKTNSAFRMTLLMSDQQDRHELRECIPLYDLIMDFISVHIPHGWGSQLWSFTNYL